jgi:hypothetical protein
LKKIRKFEVNGGRKNGTNDELKNTVEKERRKEERMERSNERKGESIKG